MNCTIENQNNCECEKRGCDGCYYKGQRTMSKLMLSSLYGKFATSLKAQNRKENKK